MATNSRMMFRPKNTIRRITKSVNGSAYRISTMRIIAASGRPPTKPATAP